jgi:hypothetical protein
MKKSMTRLLLVLCLLGSIGIQAQPVQVSLAPLEGVELKPDNIFSYQLVNNSGKPQRVKITGTVVFRQQQQLRFSYQVTATLQTGISFLNQLPVSPVWDFSSSGLKELFLDYGKLPQGSYRYCVSLQLLTQGGEQTAGSVGEECVYQTVNDIFLISLAEPEDNAKLYETHPGFAWMVNYPFASQLTYRLRVAPLQQGQNKANAITRNPAVYTEQQIIGLARNYPATARELEKFKPYVWTVDAYYKDVLLGGAAPWVFTIIEDTLRPPVIPVQPYFDVVYSGSDAHIYAVGSLKLKYVLREAVRDDLSYQLFDASDKPVSVSLPVTHVAQGDNLYELDLAGSGRLRHQKIYRIDITNTSGKRYSVHFIYINPDLTKG